MPQKTASSSTRRFSPEGIGFCIDRPGDLRYRCPRCSRSTPRFQLRSDSVGVPRRVDVVGCLCAECMLEENLHIDGYADPSHEL